MFKYQLRLPDGEPPDPALLVTAVPTWSVGDVITLGRGEQPRQGGQEEIKRLSGTFGGADGRIVRT